MSEIIELIALVEATAKSAEGSILPGASLDAATYDNEIRPRVVVHGLSGYTFPKEGEFGDRFRVTCNNRYNTLFVVGEADEDPADVLHDAIAFLSGDGVRP